jgi:hypothetical protein
MVLDLGGFGTNLEAKVRCFFKKICFWPLDLERRVLNP